MVTLYGSIFSNTFSTSQLVWSTCFKQTSVTPLEKTKAVLERRNSKSYPDLSETPSQIYMFRQHRCQRDPSRPPSVTAGKARQGCRSLEGCHAALAKTIRGEASEVGVGGNGGHSSCAHLAAAAAPPADRPRESEGPWCTGICWAPSPIARLSPFHMSTWPRKAQRQEELRWRWR